MRIRMGLIAVTVVCGLLPPMQSLAQKPLKSEVFVELRTANGSSQFQIGEAIPLQLIFTTSSPGKYKVNKATYDRSGRLGIDDFEVSPLAGWTDPLEVYYQSQESFDMGGLFNEDDLGKKPVVVEDTLNEWVRFDKPGEYVVTAKSSRAHHKRGDAMSGSRLESNSITLRISIADNGWQERTFSAAVRVLDQKDLTARAQFDNEGRKIRAAETLSFLGTVKAAEKLASLIGSTNFDGNLMIGLIGTPRKTEAMNKMKELMQDPNFPVTNTFISAMALLELTPHAGGKLSNQREQLEQAHLQELKRYVDQKVGEARVTTLKTLKEQ